MDRGADIDITTSELKNITRKRKRQQKKFHDIAYKFGENADNNPIISEFIKEGMDVLNS